MRAGRLDRRVTIQSATRTKDAGGQPVASWSTTATVWATVQPLRGDERLVAQQQIGHVDTRFRIRNNDDISVSVEDRLVLDSENYVIRSILPFGRRGVEGLEILATKVAT